MNDKVIIKSEEGNKIVISELDFQKAMLQYMREASPDRDRVKIIAEERNDGGRNKPVPVLVMILSKNPAEILNYAADVIPLEKKPSLFFRLLKKIFGVN